MKKEVFKRGLYEIGITILLLIFNVILISSLLFIFKISITKFHFIIGLILTIILAIIYYKKTENNNKNICIKIILFLLIVIGSIAIASNVYDLSWDGNSYHKTAVGELKNGWNPVYENIEDFNASENNSLKLMGTHDIWTNHYAKGQWIFGASTYAITGNIESGKCINFLMIIALLLIVFSYLLDKVNLCLNIIMSLLIAFSPVSVVQMFTYYNDILIYSLVVIELIILQKLFEGKIKKFDYFALLITLLILVNVKFTGIAFGGLIMLVYYIFIIAKKNFRKQYLKHFTVLGVIVVLFGICFIGYSTYTRNFLDYGNPLYPLFGENKVDIMTSNQPSSFTEMNRFEKFIYSNFSTSANITAFELTQPTLKIPFTFTVNETKQVGVPDLRIGGFGALFGGILIVSSIILIVGMYFLYNENRKLFRQFAILLFSILLFIIILEEAWWARYFPLLYLLPFISILILYHFRNRKINVILLFTLIIMLLLNICPFLGYNTFSSLKRYKTVREELKYIQNIDNVYIYTTYYNGAMYNAYDVNPNITVIDDSDLSGEYTNIYNNMLQVYIKGE